MKKKIVCLMLSVCMCLAVSLAFTGCGNKKNVIKINEVTHSVFYAPLYLAEALGYFDDEGLKIELENGGGADKTMSAVLAGAADVGFCGPEAVIYVDIGGSDDAPKVFGQLTKRDGSFLVGRTKQDDFKWSDLDGKDVLAGRPGGVPCMTFQYVCDTAGISPNYVTNIDFNLMTAAFKGGTAEYCTMFEPVASDYQAAGDGYIVASVGKESGEIPYTCFMAKSSYIEKNTDKVEGLLRAVTRAIKYLNEADNTEIAGYLKDYFVNTTVESLANSVKNYKDIDAWVDNMAMQESAFNRLQDVIENAGELQKRVEFKNIVITEYADKIYKEVYKK